jgi:hypothetical protein
MFLWWHSQLLTCADDEKSSLRFLGRALHTTREAQAQQMIESNHGMYGYVDQAANQETESHLQWVGHITLTIKG